ncbi:MAG TPA: PAS domain S-box protein [Candidatus Sulfopaludibacter sp.]|nr:PAS domain S-box protein [Candidatus Sulfopaludibacter sp.]
MARPVTHSGPPPAELSRIRAILRPYAVVLAAQAALVLTTYLVRNTFGIKVALVGAVIQILYLILLLGSAWLGYGPGLLVWTTTLLVVPKILRTARNNRALDPVVVGLVLLVSILISRISQIRRRREAELVRAAEELERRVEERTEEAVRAADAEREAEERLRFVLDAGEIGYWDLDLDKHSSTRSPRHDRIFGYAEPLPHWDYQTFLRHVHPDDRDRVDLRFRESMARVVAPDDFRIVWPDGSVHWIWVQSRTHLDSGGRPDHVSGVTLDITQRKRTEDNLREQAQLLNLAHDAILSLDRESIIRFWSRGAEEMYGWSSEEALGRVSHQLLQSVFPESLEEIGRSAGKHGHWEGEMLQSRKDGSQIRVSSRWAVRHDGSGTPLGFLEINTDITEKRRIEEQLRHTQKLESLGVLAGGVAHDFNNLLTGILGNASLALDKLGAQHPDRLLIEEVMKAAERAADLTRQLLAYAGKGRFVMRTVNLSRLVREIGGLVQTSIPKVVQLRLQLADTLPGIDADPGQLQQIVMNLVINGAEAIGPEGGTVLVRTGVQQVDQQYIATMSATAGALQPGEYVCLEVHDTGCGMDAETLQKIFDPFFTTKFAGRGLGLSAVLGIVNAHRGALRVYSEPGQGTTFKVLFPGSRRPLEAAPSESMADLAGSGTVLVVDDEEVVRQTARHTLERYGYLTVSASDGASALDLYRRLQSEICLVLLDLTMPVMNGEEALHQMQSINPQVRVLLTSGYNEVEAVQRFAGKGLAGFIQKPYTASALAEKVKQVLVRKAVG